MRNERRNGNFIHHFHIIRLFRNHYLSQSRLSKGERSELVEKILKAGVKPNYKRKLITVQNRYKRVYSLKLIYSVKTNVHNEKSLK